MNKFGIGQQWYVDRHYMSDPSFKPSFWFVVVGKPLKKDPTKYKACALIYDNKTSKENPSSAVRLGIYSHDHLKRTAKWVDPIVFPDKLIEVDIQYLAAQAVMREREWQTVEESNEAETRPQEEGTPSGDSVSQPPADQCQGQDPQGVQPGGDSSDGKDVREEDSPGAEI